MRVPGITNFGVADTRLITEPHEEIRREKHAALIALAQDNGVAIINARVVREFQLVTPCLEVNYKTI